MESSSLSIIVPIAVGLIIFLIERASEKKTGDKNTERPRKPVIADSHQAAEVARRADAARYAALSRRRAAAKAAEESAAAVKSAAELVSPVLPDERVCVTSEKPVKVPAKVRAAVPPVPGGDLRKAIIWSEILKRKF